MQKQIRLVDIPDIPNDVFDVMVDGQPCRLLVPALHRFQPEHWHKVKVYYKSVGCDSHRERFTKYVNKVRESLSLDGGHDEQQPHSTSSDCRTHVCACVRAHSSEDSAEETV